MNARCRSITPVTFILAFLSPIALWNPSASAQEGWYVIGNFGKQATSPPGLEIPFENPTVEDDYLSGALGFRQGAFRAEGQFLYAEHPEESFDGDQALRQSSADLFPLEDVIGPDAGSVAVMANGYYDYSVTPRWRLFAGAGLGVARLSSESAGDALAPTTELDNTHYQNGDAHIAYQGMLGLTYQVNDPFEVFVGYRFFAAENLGLSSGQDSSTANPEAYTAHSGLIGFRYNF